jgi:predicted secreted acid phosphatase
LRRLILLLWLFLAIPSVAEVQPLSEFWYQTSGEYRALCLQTYNLAAHKLEVLRTFISRGAEGDARIPGSTKPLAIIMDLDETVIDNSGYQVYLIKANTNFDALEWDKWLDYQSINKGAQRAVPGAVEFIRRAEGLGITPIFISNRSHDSWDETRKVLKGIGVNTNNLEERMLLRRADGPERAMAMVKEMGLDPASSKAQSIINGEGEKEERRRQIYDRYHVIAFFGDVLSDFEGLTYNDQNNKVSERAEMAHRERTRWGTDWFILPNPLYGTWGPPSALKEAEMVDAMTDYGFGQWLRRNPAMSK